MQSNIIYFSWKFQLNLFLIYPLVLLFLDEQTGRVNSVKIKLILSCRTNYITKRQWCNSNEVVLTVEAAWPNGYNAAGLLAPCSRLALLTASWTCSLQSRVQSSSMVGLLPAGILSFVMFYLNYCFTISETLQKGRG